MKRYLIDTGPLGAALLRRPAAVELLTPFITHHEVATSIVVYGELIEYIRGRPDFAHHQRQLRELLREVSPYFLTYNIFERYADLRRELRRGAGLIGDMDTLIAATALERNLTIVTADQDFQKVPNLKVMLIPRNSLRR